MSDYCDYHNAEWCKRFDGIKNHSYKTRIEGNTLYIIERIVVCDPVYKKLFGRLYFRTNSVISKEPPAKCTIPMCNLKESTMIEMLKSYGFEIEERMES